MFRYSTIITDISAFDIERFSANEVGVEIQTFPQHILDGNLDELVKRWEAKLDGFQFPRALHGASFDLNPGSTDGKIIEVTRLRYLQSISIAKQLSVEYVVFHSQINPLISVDRVRRLKINNQIEFWKDLFAYQIPSDINILIENEYDDTFEDILQIVKGVNRPNFGVCLDIGHILAYSSKSIEEWICELKDYIKYVHLHWNDRNSDQHSPPKNSELEFLKKLFIKYKISPVICLEYNVKDLSVEVARVKSVL